MLRFIIFDKKSRGYLKKMVGLSNFVENQPEVLKWLIIWLARQYHVGIGKSMENIQPSCFLSSIFLIIYLTNSHREVI
jgi:hypothetical protein